MPERTWAERAGHREDDPGPAADDARSDTGTGTAETGTAETTRPDDDPDPADRPEEDPR